jgi:homoserine dehydrogenase
MQKPLTLGIAGLGTVGAGLLDLLHTHKARFAERAGRPVEIVGISARSKGKDRGVDTSGIKWFDDPVALAKDASIDAFVELIGGSDGVAKAAVEAALNAGKHVVTANKALVAKHGVGLAKLAEEKGVALNFEAAVAGGIPVIKTLRESLAANEVTRVYGILNGTCNYILSTMTDQHRSFADALREAQDLGYAEADPTYDIGGFDTAHKLAILTSLAFGTELGFDQVDVEGIQSISEVDIEAAQDMGFAIKLLGVATRTEGGIEARVHPAMVPEESAISEVWGATNAVAIDADFCASLLLVVPRPPLSPATSWISPGVRLCRRLSRRHAASNPIRSRSWAGIKGPTTCGFPSTIVPAPWRRSPSAWATARSRSKASCSGVRARRCPAWSPGRNPARRRWSS